jgi:serine phosphatase RsbU (regulator of sigma subunit)
MSALNEEFLRTIDTEHYITAFYAILDFHSMRCQYCNAGHPPQIVFGADGITRELQSDNPIIGMTEGYRYENFDIPIHPGDLFCFFTDGVIEAWDESGAMFDGTGVKRAVESASAGDIDQIADTILSELIQFMKNPVFEDDITIVLGQVTEEL